MMSDDKKEEGIEKVSEVISDKENRNKFRRKLKETEDKLLRSLAEIEIKEEDLKKEIKDAFELALLTLQKKVYQY